MTALTNAPFVHAKLLTQNNEDVMTLEVPPFEPPPVVIIWGHRVFVRADPALINNMQYLEVFAYVAPIAAEPYRGTPDDPSK